MMKNQVFICNWYESGKHLLAYSVENIFIWDSKSNFKLLDAFVEKHKGKHIFAFISYDFKNEIENLESINYEFFSFPILCFWTAKKVVLFNDLSQTLIEGNENSYDFEIKQIIENFYKDVNIEKIINFKSQISKTDYIEKVNYIKKQIKLGNTYELNFCQLFQTDNILDINSISFFGKLTRELNAPFSCYLLWDNFELFCSSPERFFRIEDNILISQPMKGTSNRGKNKKEDELLLENLKNDQKEISENIMITDLVRNDLSKFAENDSVKVDELCSVYTFTNVHQMISTISCTICENTKFSKLISSLFPMGSMTGAPKINTMRLIDKVEEFQRNIYSGTLGFIKPNGNMDFNVIIRSLIQNNNTNKMYCPVGGAITIKSDAENEYKECLIKVSKLFDILNDK